MNKTAIQVKPFKICSYCDIFWKERADFIDSSNIVLLGYQSNLDDIESGLILFNHAIEMCGTTIGIPVKKFGDLYDGEKFSESKFGTDECEKRCLNKLDIERCKSGCKFAYVREILQILKK